MGFAKHNIVNCHKMRPASMARLRFAGEYFQGWHLLRQGLKESTPAAQSRDCARPPRSKATDARACSRWLGARHAEP